jgi:hypothetical protein
MDFLETVLKRKMDFKGSLMRISVKRLSGISESYQKNLISFKNIGFSLRFGHNFYP